VKNYDDSTRVGELVGFYRSGKYKDRKHPYLAID